MLALKDLDFRGKSVFLRVDFNVPLDEEGRIRDETRITAALPTIRHLLEQGARLIIASHLGRPNGQFNPRLSLKPVAFRLAELLKVPVKLAPDVIGDEVNRLKCKLTEGQVLLLENIRFYAEETANDDDFARQLAQGIDLYVNDAFGACHRSHASVVAITRHVRRAAAGILVQKEVEFLSRAVHTPEKPYVAILGGAKVSDKIPVIRSLLNKANDILVGGAMAYTFFAALGKNVGRSKVEEDLQDTAILVLDEAQEKGVDILLPLDHLVALSVEAPKPSLTVEDFPIPKDMMALDIGPKTISRYRQIIAEAKTIFWNGPMGVFENEAFAEGTIQIARAVAESGALSIVGGGDSVAAVDKAGLSGRITHISTGGGASLEYIANESLPGIEALSEK